MCEACFEMELYFAYLNEVEERKKAEQSAEMPWQCEVTVFAQAEAATAPAVSAAPAQGKSRFVCDEPK